MNVKNLIICLFLGFNMVSCIQDEALNSEAAIDGCSGPDIQQAGIDTDNKSIQLYVSKSAELSQVNINFSLPSGARIVPSVAEPKDDAPHYDFSGKATRKFTVISEDGAWKSEYSIRIWQTELPTEYHFETLSTSTAPYHIFYERNESDRIIQMLEWSSGNPGYKLTGMSNSAMGYPTVQASGGKKGNCVKLETLSTGSFGEMVKMYIAAGNLFIGSFDLANALADAPKATKFGFPFYETPVSLVGWYKYKAGTNYTEKNIPVQGKKDKCDIYSILYETDNEVQFLDGTNSLKSDHIISIARNPEAIGETDEWTYFELPFKLKEGKKIVPEKLKKGIYKLAIVFSSSIDGAEFNGAVGSTLYIDEVKLNTETIE